MLILNVKISGETVSISYENNKVLEIEILLKTYIEFPFYSNQEIDEIIFKKMIKKDEENRMYEEAYSYLKKSDLTSDELLNKLLKKHPKKIGVINQILKDLKEKNLINDECYVNHFIKKGINSFKGFERIKYELIVKGIKEELIYENFDEELQELELEKAYTLGNKQLRLSKNLEFRKARDKVYYKLAYAGYSKDIIEEIMYKLNLIKEI